MKGDKTVKIEEKKKRNLECCSCSFGNAAKAKQAGCRYREFFFSPVWSKSSRRTGKRCTSHKKKKT